MNIDLEAVGAVIDLVDPKVKSVFDVVVPYLPALKKAGKTGVDMFMGAATSGDWDRIDRELYEHMTEDERDALGAAVLAEARKAVQSELDQSELPGQICRVMLGIALALI